MAAKVEVQAGEVGRTGVGGRLHLSPLTDSSNKTLIEIPSINQSHIITTEPSKPVPGPKPRLSAKPFSVERNPTIKPILAPKPQPKPRPEATRPPGPKPELPSSPKPPQTAPTGKPRAGSTNPNRLTSITVKSSNRLSAGQTTKPVVHPFKPAPPLIPGDPGKPVSPAPAVRQRPSPSSVAYAKTFKKLPAEWSGSTKNEDEKDQKGSSSISRAKSMGSLDLCGQEEEENTKAKPEAAVPLRPQPRGSRTRPVSAIFLDSPNKTEAPAPAPRWAGRRPLSADLTSKFESVGLSLHRKTPKADAKENTPEEKVPPQVTEKTPNSGTPQRTDAEAAGAGPDQSVKTTEELTSKEPDEQKRAASIKKRISLLLDSSSSPGAGPTGQDVFPPLQPGPETEPAVGVKQLIRQLTEDPTPTQSPVLKPSLKPRPLPLDLTKRFSSERSPDPGGEATEHRDISKDPQMRTEESAITPSEQRTFADLKDSLMQTFMEDGAEAEQTFSSASKDSGPSADVQKVRASLFENVVERHNVMMVDEGKAKESLGSPSLRRGSSDEGTLVTAVYKEPVSPSSPLRVLHSFDTVQAVDESRAVSESIPSAHREDKAMTLRSRRSEGSRPTEERNTEPALSGMPEQQPRYLRVGALPKWSITGLEQDSSKGPQQEGQAVLETSRDRQREAEQGEVAAAPKRLKMLPPDEQPKPRATYFALTGQIQEPVSPSLDMNSPFDDLSVRSQGKLHPIRRNPSLDEAYGKSSRDQAEESTERKTADEMMEVEKKRELVKEAEHKKAKLKELEREKQRQLELEKETHLEFERMKERERQREFERQRQKAYEKEKQEFEEKQRALERQRQKELENQRLQELEREKQERERQRRLEKEKRRELERKKKIELEKLREEEKERQREQERLRQREEEKQRELDRERQLLELQKEKQRMEELERVKEMERQQLLEFQKQKQKEKERMQILEKEKQRLREKMEREEAEKMRQLALEQEMLRLRELDKERERQKEMDRELEKQRELDRQRQIEIDRERQRQLDKEGQELENQRQRRELEKERQKKKEEMERMKEMERRQLLEFEKQKQAERERQQTVELEKRKLREKMEKEEADKLRLIAKQQEAERQRLKENQRKAEQERARLEASALRPKVVDLDSVLRNDPFSKASPQHSDPATRWKEPSPRAEEPYKPAILDIDSFTSQAQHYPSKDLFPVSGIQGSDAGFGARLQPSAERDISWKMPAQTTADLTSPVWTTSPQDPWELRPVEMSVDKPASEPRKTTSKTSPDQLLLRFTEERIQTPQRHRPAAQDEPVLVSPLAGKDAETVGSAGSTGSTGGVSSGYTAEQLWLQREPHPPDSRPEAQRHRRSHGAQELNRMRSRSVSRRSAPSSSAVEGSLSRMRSRSAHREQDRHSWEQQKQAVSGEDEARDSETPVHETDSQYGTWETGLRTDDSLTPATPSSEGNLSPSPRKPSPPDTPGEPSSLFDADAVDSLPPSSSSESQPFSFPDAPVTLLDTSALRSRAQLGKKRAPRTRPSRAALQSSEQAEDWTYRDSTEPKVEVKDSDSDSEEPARGADSIPAVASQPQRVALFPGMDPLALKAQLKKRGDADNQTDGSAPSPQLSRSPKSPFLPRAARVLPPPGSKENGEEDSPQWLKELKSKKRLSQYENES